MKIASSMAFETRLPFVVQSNCPPLEAVGPSERSLATSANDRPSRTSLPISASWFQASCLVRVAPNFTVNCSKRAFEG